MPTISIPQRSEVQNPPEQRYLDFLDCLPLPDLQAELERLDAQIDENSDDMSFGLSVHKRSDLAFSVVIERFTDGLNSSSKMDRDLKILSLHEIQELRAAGSQIRFQLLEYTVRKTLQKYEPGVEPDVSPIQNLISLYSNYLKC